MTIDLGEIPEGVRVAVIGSLNADLIAYESAQPAGSDYNIGEAFELGIGGKGLNVAMSVAATGISPYLVGRLGNDIFGGLIRRALNKSRVNHDFVETDGSGATGVGHVRVNAEKDYDTCVVPGVNGSVDHTDIDRVLASGLTFTHLVLDFEIPLEAALYAVRAFRAMNAKVIVNFSPPTHGSRALLPYTDVLVVNEKEAFALWLDVVGADQPLPISLWTVIDRLRRTDEGYRDVVVTLGPRGVWGMSAHGELRQLTAHPIDTVNAVGAGDSFLAMLVSSLARGTSLLDSLYPAAAGGALACSRRESWLNINDGPRIFELMQNRSILMPARSRKV
ncbi:PfkB family carbohydrate kinase [Nonomuraea sp. H19]|uniref:PfkB family carbohydrate kinase n=1 Tax=Nonomuraea sp. H19 TaxID=3452206 RepID=UPI003F88EC84